MSSNGDSARGPRVVAREYDVTRQSVLSAYCVRAEQDRETRIGRTVALDSIDGVLELGAEPNDEGVSREALRVTPRSGAWEVTITNQRGAVLHDWGMAGRWLEPGCTETKRSSRLAIRVLGATAGLEHWILLENDAFTRQSTDRSTDGDGCVNRTNTHRPPTLTDKQQAALRAVFAQYLAWPPRSNPQPAKLQSVARTLGISETGVTERLEGAKSRAQALGLHEQFGVTQPDYLYALVAHGYVDPPLAYVEAETFGRANHGTPP